MLSLSFMSRLASFSLNLALAKKSSYAVLGQVQDLELLSASLLFLCRESFRMALLRSPPRPEDKSQRKWAQVSDEEWEREETTLATNVAYLPLLIGLLLTRVFFIYKRWAALSSQDSGLPAHLYITGALIELAAEPLAIYAQRRLLYSIRASSEGLAVVSQCILTLLWFPASNQTTAREWTNLAVLAYSWAYLCSSIMLWLCYFTLLSWRALSKSDPLLDLWWSFLPKRSHISGEWIDSFYMSIVYSFWAQSFLKHLLTVGDKFLLVLAGVSDDQKGIYRLVSDLGSLIARLVFQPLEETSRAFFSKSLTGDKESKTHCSHSVHSSIKITITRIRNFSHII